MSSQVISYRFSPDEVLVLREKALPGESDNQTAQRLMREVLGLSTGTSTETVKASTSNLSERIESLEEKVSTCTDLFTCLQKGMQSLQEWRQAVEAQAIALPPTSPVEDKSIVDSTVDNTVDSVDLTLTGKELSRRLEVHPATITKNRAKPSFIDWTRSRDPEGKAWQYLAEIERYTPYLSTVVSTESTGEDDSLAGWKAQVDAVVGAL